MVVVFVENRSRSSTPIWTTNTSDGDGDDGSVHLRKNATENRDRLQSLVSGSIHTPIDAAIYLYKLLFIFIVPLKNLSNLGLLFEHFLFFF